MSLGGEIWNALVLGAGVGLCRALRPLRPPIPLPDGADWRRIVLVQNTALGDTILSGPAIRAVRLSFPQARIALIGHQRHESLLRLNPHIDHLLIYRGKAKSFLPLRRILQDGRFEVGVVLHGNDPETIPLLWSGGVRRIVADSKTRFGFLLSRQIPWPGPERHLVDHRLDLAGAIGAWPHGRGLEQAVDQETLGWAEDFLRRNFGPDRPVVALAPGGSSPYKRWPAGRFSRLAQRLQDELGAGILILASSAEAGLAREVAQGLTGPTLSTDGRVSLIQISGLLARSRFLVANDSGLFHLGLALRTPALGIFGAESPAQYGPIEAPWGEALSRRDQACPIRPCLKKNCPRPACLEAVDADMVAQRVLARIG